MTDEPANGRATIREVYQLVGEVDGKVDLILAALSEHETRLAIIEKTCTERPQLCRMEHSETRRRERKEESAENWTWTQRWGWVIATTVAIGATVVGLIR